ncbi:MAG: protein kinase [Alphaproteobacteria bacterium]|nr:protein kinase [Alphaproteobacteria bacterium]
MQVRHEDSLPPGTRLGRYVLGEAIGHGGMGTVYAGWLASGSGLRVPVAIKILRALDDPAAAERLVHEACIGGLASHPNVVAALDLCCEEGRWFIVMEHVDGVSAEVLRARGPLPTLAALDLVAQAAAGLAYFHDLDVPGVGHLVHGDIKPHNLLVDSGGLVRVADFGVAAASGTVTTSGTYTYLAPEQWGGRSLQASDVFALGLVLYLLVVGERLLEGRARTPLSLNIDAVVVERAVEERTDALVPGLGGLLLRMLASDPEARPRAEEVADGLRRLALSQRGVSLASLVAIPLRSPDTASRPPLVGRSRERDALLALLAEHRVVGVSGAAGVGKTRLAEDLEPDVRVDLIGCASLAGLVERVARARSRPVPPEVEEGWLASTLRGAERVLLDGADAILPTLVAELRGWDGAQVVITSRARAAGLPEVEVGPLDPVSARTLFLQRASRFAPTRILDELVEALDRLPLAIELAATSGQEPEALLAALRRPLGVLEQTGGTGESTLYAAISTSWDLLSTAERRTLVALSVFRGRPTVEDALAVLGDVGGLEEVLALVDRHLVLAQGARLGLLGTVRAFAVSKRSVVGDLEPVLERHATRLAQRGADTVLTGLKRRGGSERFRGFLADEPDLDAALAWAIARGRPEAGALAAAKLQIQLALGPIAPGAVLVDRVLPLVEDAGTRAALLERKARVHEHQGRSETSLQLATQGYKTAPPDALGVRSDCRRRAGLALMRLGRVEEAQKVTRAALADAEKGGDAFRAAEAHLNLALVESMRGDLAGEVYHQEAARRFAEGSGYVRLLGYVLGNIASRMGYTGDVPGAVPVCLQALACLEEVGDEVSYQNTRGTLAALYTQRGELDEARRVFEDILAHSRRQAHHAATSRYACLLAGVELDSGHLGRAATLLEEAGTLAGSYRDNDLVRRLVTARLRTLQGLPEAALAMLPEETGVSEVLQVHADLERARAYLALHEAARALPITQRVIDGPLRRPLLKADARVMRARARMALGQPDAGRGLDAVADFVERVGMTPRARLRRELEALRADLRAGWGAPPSRGPGGP